MKTESSFNWMLLLLTVSECSSSAVVGRTGHNVTLDCRYDIKKYGPEFMCWNRAEIPSSHCDNKMISTDGRTVTTRTSSRFQLLGRLDEGDVSLTILNLTESDSGRYGCRVEIRGLFNDVKHHFDLTVERAPLPTTLSGPTGSDVTPPRGSDVTPSRGSDVTPPRGSDVTPSRGSDVTGSRFMVTVGQEQVNSLQIFIGNTLRVFFIIFIPALLLTAAHRLCRRTDRRLNQSEQEEEEHSV